MSSTTGSQTVGPFFRIGLSHLYEASHSAKGGAKLVTIHGRVIDGEGHPVPDAVLEVWHADGEGRLDDVEPDPQGRPPCFTRAATDDDGAFRFSIPRPGAVPCDAVPMQAPHVAVIVFARGLMRQMITRMYFAGDPKNGNDPVLQIVPEERRRTLIAHEGQGEPGTFEWNVVLQGENETAFFAW